MSTCPPLAPFLFWDSRIKTEIPQLLTLVKSVSIATRHILVALHVLWAWTETWGVRGAARLLQWKAYSQVSMPLAMGRFTLSNNEYARSSWPVLIGFAYAGIQDLLNSAVSFRVRVATYPFHNFHLASTNPRSQINEKNVRVSSAVSEWKIVSGNQALFDYFLT
jgi:hypothetical protein